MKPSVFFNGFSVFGRVLDVSSIGRLFLDQAVLSPTGRTGAGNGADQPAENQQQIIPLGLTLFHLHGAPS